MPWRPWLMVIVFGVLVFGCKVSHQGEQAVVSPRFVVLEPEELARGKAMADRDEVSKALSTLVTGCNWALEQAPRSVVFSEKEMPGTDPHDYVSLSTYYWPNPDTPDGLPWVLKDGEVNPVAATHDKKSLDFVCSQARILALGHAFTSNKAYAVHAAKLLRVFFLDPATRMNPNLAHAQMITGKNTGTASGIIDSRVLLKILDVPALLASSKALSPAEVAGLKKWCGEYLDWLLTSKHGLHEGQAANNHGTWYDAQVVGLALFAGRQETAKAQLAKVASRLETQFNAEGLQPKEILRTKSLNSQLFNLEGLFVLALMGEKIGDNLWAFTSPSGRSLRQALDALRPYLRGDRAWPHQQLRELSTGDMRQVALLLRLGSLKFGGEGYEQDLDHVLGTFAPGLDVNLSFPTPVPADGHP